MNRSLIAASAALLALTACKQLASQNQYNAREVGTSRAVVLGTVLSVREVPIFGKSSGTGILLGAGAGAGAGSGGGNAWATAGGAVAGTIAGHLIEREVVNRTGLEYILRTDEGETKSIVEEKVEGDVLFKKGDRVMLQLCDAGDNYKKCVAGNDYQRLLPTDIPAPRVLPSPAPHKKHHKSIDVYADPDTSGGDDGR